MVKIVADKDIPLVEHFFGSFGELVLMDGRELTRRNLQAADVLLVRSITKVNKDLLDGTKVKFVASPTTGFDHFDTKWLEEAGVRWSVASGCNAVAVAEYVVCAIAGLQKKGFLTQKNPRAGVIGVGKIGSKVAKKLELLGFDVVLCDPIRADNEKDFISTSLEELNNLDLITLHTPLTSSGPYPTFHMIEKSFLAQQKDNCVLMNTSRGSVIHCNDLKMAGEQLIWCLDVWENEPYIDFAVLDTALLATPHIAGYTVQSKCRGTEMIYQAALQHKVIPDFNKTALPYATQTLKLEEKNTDWRDVVLKIYDPFVTTEFMKEKMIENDVKAFDMLRKNFIEFAERYEFGFVDIENITLAEKDRMLLQKLGVNHS